MDSGTGIKSNASGVYLYVEPPVSGSSAIGMDSSDDNRFKIVVQTTRDADVTTGSPSFLIDVNSMGAGSGEIQVIPIGSGNFVVGGTATIDVAAFATSAANGGIVQSNGSGVCTSTAGTNGQLLIGSTGGAPAWANITSSGATVTITNTSHGINLETAGGGGYAELPYTNVTGSTQTMAASNGYMANNAGLVTLTLPTTAAFGTIIEVTGFGAGGWLIAQNSGQIIHYGNQNTTSGATGSLSSQNQYDVVRLLCVVANTSWSARSTQGNITVT
jgi:hypothetical protein